MPAAQPATAWLNEPVFWRKATWVPSGAGGLPAVKPLPLPAMPAPPAKVQGEPVGPVPELAGPHRHLLEPRVADGRPRAAWRQPRRRR